jgi:hypothetical protein
MLVCDPNTCASRYHQIATLAPTAIKAQCFDKDTLLTPTLYTLVGRGASFSDVECDSAHAKMREEGSRGDNEVINSQIVEITDTALGTSAGRRTIKLDRIRVNLSH